MTQPRSSGATLERGDVAHSSVNFATALRRPIQLIRIDNGQPCKALLFGDIAGMSPAYLVSDEQGKQSWVAVADTIVADPEYLSDSADKLTKFGGQLTQRVGKATSNY